MAVCAVNNGLIASKPAGLRAGLMAGLAVVEVALEAALAVRAMLGISEGVDRLGGGRRRAGERRRPRRNR